MNFDPSLSISSEFGIFGIPITEADAKLILLPVPWEVTTSYGVGASNGPRIIRQASEQVDLYDFETGKAYEKGIFMRSESEELRSQNKVFKAKAQELIQLVSSQSKDEQLMKSLRNQVNTACEKMSDWVYQQSKEILNQGKTLGLVGGDHSTPLGAIQAVSEFVEGDFGILHIDAHADLREQYQGFHQSHASIMHNVMTSNFKPKKLVQVGIRDFCEEELNFSKNPANRIKTHFDIALKQRQLAGETWATLSKEVISDLPKNVYVSFDIDGLDPSLCPSTGTPVPGGLSLNEVFYLFRELHQSGRQIIAFDLNEVSTGPNEEAEWDGNVGARVLYKLCGWALTEQG